MYYLTLVLIYLSSLLLIGCDGSRPKVVDTDILPYIERFEAYYNNTVEYSVTFTDTMDNPAWVGVCYIYETGNRNVEINRHYWEDASDNEKEELIFHELGHCTLNRDHRSDKIAYKNSSVPISIMYPYVFGHATYYEERKTEYIEELFHGNVGTGIRTISSIGDVVIYN